MPNDNTNDELLRKLEEAKQTAVDADARLAELLGQVEDAQIARMSAMEAVETAHLEATAEERAAKLAEAEVNEHRHRTMCREQCDHIASRKGGDPYRSSPEPNPDPTAIGKMMLDGHTHEIVAAHGLKHGHRGFGDQPREASRFVAACKLSVDAPHDELHHERFDQTSEVDCPGCLAAAQEGTAPRSDYLTADEHQAHQRALNKTRNREARQRGQS